MFSFFVRQLMSEPSVGDVTELLQLVSSGATGAKDDLLRVVYRELKDLAASRLRHEQNRWSLETTGLINEVYLRMFSSSQPIQFQDRRHFFSVAAEAMRRVLVDEARKRSAAKRVAQVCPSVDLNQIQMPEESTDVLALHDAIERLDSARPEVAELVKLRYFAGMTIRETAECLEISPRTADNYWAYAKVFLLKAMEEDRQ